MANDKLVRVTERFGEEQRRRKKCEEEMRGDQKTHREVFQDQRVRQILKRRWPD